MKRLGFTLLELMMVVTIIGIIAAIGVPNYRKYVIRSKMAEAHSTMSAIQKTQFTHFNEHQEFFQVNDVLPQYVRQPMIITNVASWGNFGYPVGVGSRVHFSYRAFAGKIDETGTQLSLGQDSASGYGFVFLDELGYSRGHFSSSGPICNSGLVSGENMGALSQPNYNWAIIYAVGDLNNDEGLSCTGLVRLLEASPSSQNYAPTSRGVVILNEGE